MRLRDKTGLSIAALIAAGQLLSVRRRWHGFKDKVVLITGGSRGLGLVLAREFAARGAKVAICARDAEELDRARQDLEKRGAEVFAVTCDVGEKTQVEAMVASVEGRFGAVDVLVNNAGTIQVGPLETDTVEDFEAAMKVHYWGPLYAVLAVVPKMKVKRDGRIVNIASIGGKIAVPHLLPYSGSKFALVGLSEGLRAELARDGIMVTTVCPGLMRTGSPVNALFKGKSKREYAWFAVSDSLPLASISARRAARRIVEACRRGEAEVILSLPAKLAAAFHGLLPGVASRLLSVVNRALPAPGGLGPAAVPGYECESAVTESFLTRLSREAAAANNELSP